MKEGPGGESPPGPFFRRSNEPVSPNPRLVHPTCLLTLTYLRCDPVHCLLQLKVGPGIHLVEPGNNLGDSAFRINDNHCPASYPPVFPWNSSESGVGRSIRIASKKELEMFFSNAVPYFAILRRRVGKDI